jgi:hypothetical protein
LVQLHFAVHAECPRDERTRGGGDGDAWAGKKNFKLIKKCDKIFSKKIKLKILKKLNKK